MGKISTYYEKQQAVKQLQDELQKMEEDKELRKELDFKEELNQLMQKYSKSGKDMLEVLATLDSSVKNRMEQSGGGSSSNDGRKKRPEIRDLVVDGVLVPVAAIPAAAPVRDDQRELLGEVRHDGVPRTPRSR